MGNQAVQKQIIALVLEKSEKIDTLNKTESAWHETNLISTKEEGPIVIKQLLKIKNEEKFRTIKTQMESVHRAIDTERKHPNVMDYHKEAPVMMKQDLSYVTLLLRQFVCHNLSEKLIHIPTLLSSIEKKWLIFQLMCSLEQIHSVPGLTHGDIKPDNILVTSYDWLYLADIHPYKPVMLMDDNLKRYNKYFGYLDNNHRCYLAPERWLTPPQTVEDSVTTMTPSMDIFSAGCVIAEIYSDGLPLFDLPKLQNYRRGGLDLAEELTKRIEDPVIVELLLKMLARDPSQRPSAKQCLREWNKKVFPDSFSTLFFHLGASFQRMSYLYSDNRIALIRFHINAIFKQCFDIDNAVVTEKFLEPMEPSLHRLCADDDTINRFQELEPQRFKFMAEQEGATDENANDPEFKKFKTEAAKESALVIINWIGQLYTSCFYSQSRVIALEMIQKISAYLPFETRIGQVLPYVSKILDQGQQEGAQAIQQANYASRVRVKALEVLLSLFNDLIDRTDVIIMEAFDFKVFQNYILPIVKKLMDQSKGDPMLRHALAINIAQLARVGTRLIEVAQGSAIRLRQEVRDKREQLARVGIRDSVSSGTLSRESSTTFSAGGNNLQSSIMMMQRRTIVQNRVASVAEGLMSTLQTNWSQNDVILEDIVVPNFDQELTGLWAEITRFIESFSGEEHDSNSLIAMLASLSDLSQIFGAEKGDYLISQCISSINRSDYQVKIQVLKTLSSLCIRCGQKQVATVLPLTESVLNDPEDLVVVQNIKMLIQFVKLRLMTKKHCQETLETMLPLLLHPNRQIRTQVATYISILANPGVEKSPEESKSGDSAVQKVMIKKAPLFSKEEFYCFIRPKLLIYSKDQSDDMLDINSAKDVLTKLRTPLSLATMREYFRQLSSAENGMQQFDPQKEEDFQKTHQMSDSDTWAFANLSDYFKQRLSKLHTFNKQKNVRNEIKKSKEKKDKDVADAGSDQLLLNPRVKQTSDKAQRPVYRCLKASAVAYLTKIELLDQIKKVAKTIGNDNTFTKDQKAAFVREYQENVSLLFDPQTQVLPDQYESENYGLNPKEQQIDEGLALEVNVANNSMTPETKNILKALNQVPLVKQADTLGTLTKQSYAMTGITQGFTINNEISMTPQAASPSLIAHFDPVEKESFFLTEDHAKEFKIAKPSPQPIIRPQGLLVTTLYEHSNPVNTVAVTDDQKYFLTGSREDRTVHVWKVQNIEEDVTSRSSHSFSTAQSKINQVTVVSRTKQVAVAGSGGMQIHDLERSMQQGSSAGTHSPRQSRRLRGNDLDGVTRIDLKDSEDDVTRCLNLITPNSTGSQLLCAATQKGGFLMHDLRAKNHVFYNADTFGCQRGAVTTMVHGSDPYQLTMGTLGGYVMVYDIRYSCISALYHHNMHYPVLAMATYKKGDEKQAPLTLVSTGGPQHELASLNLETGVVETLFACAVPSQDHDLSKTDIPVVPEYIRETNFKDNKFGTVRRETTLKQFSRQLHSVKNYEVFTDIQSAIQKKLIKSIDSQLMDVSTRQRFKLIHDACKSSNACRSILVPRHPLQRIMTDNQTAQYVITGGNDMKIRYWNLQDATKKSFVVNSPKDDEATYTNERVRDTTIIQERQLKQKELPPMTAAKLGDNSSTAQTSYYSKQTQSRFVRFEANTAYHNSIASTWNKQVMSDQQNRLQVASPETQKLVSRFQVDKGENNSMIIQNMNGVSTGQQINNLGIMTNGQEQMAGQPTNSANPAGQTDLITEQTTRNSEIVSHADTILDLALIDYKHYDQYPTPLLISCSRDSTVKVWRC